MSQQDHRRLRVVLGDAQLNEVSTRASAKHRPASDSAPGYAHFNQDEQKNCAFLSSERLCGLQLDRGEAALTNVCAHYPRHQYQFDDRAERVATLACPEAARLCLLNEHSMDRVEFDPGADFTLSRAAIRLLDSGDAHLARFERVRSVMLTIVGRRVLPLGDRLAALLLMTEELKGTFKRGRPVNDDELEGALNRAASPEFQDDLARSLDSVPASGPALVVLLSYVLNIYSEAAGSRMAKVLARVRTRHHLGKPIGDGLLDDTLFEEICYAFEQDKRHAGVFAQRIDTYLTHYALNFLLQLPFFDQGALLPYVSELLLRIATLRFLFFSDPLVAAACRNEDREALDAVAVEIVQSFAREIEHAPTFSQRLHTLLDRVKANAMGDLVCLSRL